MLTIQALFAAYVVADRAWSEELRRVYGDRSRESRYDNSQNAATPRLAQLRFARDAAAEAWRAAALGTR